MEDKSLRELKEIIESIEEGTFEGIIVGVCRNAGNDGDIGALKYNRGNAEQRILAVDLVFRAIYEEPNDESRNFFMQEMYKRWKYYFGTEFLRELALKGVNNPT